MIILGLLLCIIVWKKRHYGGCLLYYWLAYMFLSGFVPYDYGSLANFVHFVTYLGQFIAYASDMPLNIITATLVYLVTQLWQGPILFNEELNFFGVLSKLFNVVSLLIFITVIGMLVTYIAHIKGKMNQLMVENLNLLDRMHEGLIVVSEKDRNLKFASDPAIRLLK